MSRGVNTDLVKHSLVARAWESISRAADTNDRLSKKEQKTLPADYQRAAEFARRGKSGITIGDVIESYRTYVSSVLGAVDTKGKGQLSLAEAKKIYDPELRAKALDIRLRLLNPTDPFPR